MPGSKTPRCNIWLLLVLTGMIGLVAGCPPERHLPPVTDEADMMQVIRRVNANAERLTFLLRVGGVSAVGQVAHRSGRTESIDAAGTLFFRPPRNLYLQLKHSLAGRIEIGSNAREFWYWEQFDKPVYYTGRHDRIDSDASELPLCPDYLLDILGLNPLKVPGECGGPLFRVEPDRNLLEYLDRDRTGQAYVTKIVSVDRRPPFLIRSIFYYSPEGRPVMQADLRDLVRVGGTDVLVPKEVELRSLQGASHIRLRFTTLQPADNLLVEQQRIARSPLERGENVGEVIRLDGPEWAPAASQPTTAVEH